MRTLALLMACTVAFSLGAVETPPENAASTNGVASVVKRVQCHSVTKSGNRCKRKAAPGKLYCRQHAAQSPAAGSSGTCATCCRQ